LSRPPATWRGRRGYVQSHVTELAGALRPHVYVCGLNKMVSEVRRVLKQELGYDRRLIRQREAEHRDLTRFAVKRQLEGSASSACSITRFCCVEEVPAAAA